MHLATFRAAAGCSVLSASLSQRYTVERRKHPDTLEFGELLKETWVISRSEQ